MAGHAYDALGREDHDGGADRVSPLMAPDAAFLAPLFHHLMDLQGAPQTGWELPQDFLGDRIAKRYDAFQVTRLARHVQVGVV